MQKKISRYADYADAQLSDLFSQEQLLKASSVEIRTLASVFLRNDGKNGFTLKPLPQYAQVSMMNGMVARDVNHDGYKDIIFAGNFFPMRAQQGPLDAGIGSVLIGDGKGNFTSLLYPQTGLNLRGDVRNLVTIKGRFDDMLAVAKNNGRLQVLKMKFP